MSNRIKKHGTQENRIQTLESQKEVLEQQLVGTYVNICYISTLTSSKIVEKLHFGYCMT